GTRMRSARGRGGRTPPCPRCGHERATRAPGWSPCRSWRTRSVLLRLRRLFGGTGARGAGAREGAQSGTLPPIFMWMWISRPASSERPTTREGPSDRGGPAARARPPPTRPDVRLPETVYSLRVDVDRVKVREAYSGHGVKKL